jgi:hypothetical protein
MPKYNKSKKRGRGSVPRYTKTKTAFKKYKRTAKRKLGFRKAKGKRVMMKRLKARATRRKKKINKVVKRVLTSMNDDKACMYRQYIPPTATFLNPVPGQPPLQLDHTTPINNGDYVNSDSDVLKALLRRDKQGFFQMDVYRGMIAPSWQEVDSPFDDNMNFDTGQPFPYGTEGIRRVDIRAFRELELPFLPAVPAHGPSNSYNVRYTELDDFCRVNNKIKITNNYMRFRFFATKNGHIGKFSISNKANTAQQNTDAGINTGDDADMEAVGYPHANGEYRMLGLNSNVKVTHQVGGTVHSERTEHFMPQSLGGNTNSISLTKLTGNLPLSYEITARRFAKVRIIVVERECLSDDPILLSDFMKYNDTTDWHNELHYGSEELHQQKRFNSKIKTKRDIPLFLDTKMIEQKAKVKFLVDKVINLPMGREKTVIVNPLKGKVLEYEPIEPLQRYTDVGDLVSGQTGDNNEAVGSSTVDKGLPPNINSTDVLNNIAKRAEYCPTNKQYAMFMLMNCQRAGIEYDIFQKFEYDK